MYFNFYWQVIKRSPVLQTFCEVIINKDVWQKYATNEMKVCLIAKQLTFFTINKSVQTKSFITLITLHAHHQYITFCCHALRFQRTYKTFTLLINLPKPYV